MAFSILDLTESLSIMTLSVMAFNIMTLSVMTFSIMTLSITTFRDTGLNHVTQHNDTQHYSTSCIYAERKIIIVVMLNVILLGVVAPLKRPISLCINFSLNFSPLSLSIPRNGNKR